MSTMPDGAQMSEDGNYWWDGSAWQPVDQAGGGGGGSDGSGQQSQQWTFDWSQYPALSTIMQSGGDTNNLLASLGVDTSQLNEQTA